MVLVAGARPNFIRVALLRAIDKQDKLNELDKPNKLNKLNIRLRPSNNEAKCSRCDRIYEKREHQVKRKGDS